MRDREFDERNHEMIAKMAADAEVAKVSNTWLTATYPHEYSYHFEWMGVPVIQYPQDIVAMQEVIYATRPSLIVETGVARGGSLIFYASMLQLIGGGRVVGIDIDIRAPNRAAIEAHELAPQITLIEGSSIDDATVSAVRAEVGESDRVLVVLDSHHTHDHVLAELNAYAPLVSPGGYLIVFDTIVDELPAEASAHRPWSPGDSPGSAVAAFLADNDDFETDQVISDKLLLTAARGGYLRRVR